MISVSNVTMRYGAKLLFEDVSVTFTSGRRYGLTGPNGSGKSTFMKVLAGELDPLRDDTFELAQRWAEISDVEAHLLPASAHGLIHFPTPLADSETVLSVTTNCWPV